MKKFIVLSLIALIIFIPVFFLSAFLKNYIKRNGQSLLGRKIELGSLSINYLKFAVKANDLVIYESNEVDTFVAASELYANFDPLRLLSNEYSFSAVYLNDLNVNLVRNNEHFNFEDIVLHFRSKDNKEPGLNNASSHKFEFKDIQVINNSIDYYDKQSGKHINLDNFNFRLPLIAWDSKSSNVGLNLKFGQKGRVHIDANYDNSKGNYYVDLNVTNIELVNYLTYLQKYLNVGDVEGFLNADLKLSGNVNKVNLVKVKGYTSVDGLKFSDFNGNDLLAMENAIVKLESINLEKFYYYISDITLNNPVITAEINSEISNVKHALLPLLKTDSASTDTTLEVKRSNKSKFKYFVDKLSISNGEILIKDNTLNRPLTYDLKNINLTARHIANDADYIPVSFSTVINDQSTLRGQSVLSLVDYHKLSINAHVEKLNLVSFSPYSEYYLALPILQGDISYNFNLEMNNTYLSNNNSISITSLELGEKTGKPVIKAPVKLGLKILKNSKNIININLPVVGNPSNPDFSINKLIWNAFINIIGKTASSPVKAFSNVVSTHDSEFENLQMAYTQDWLDAEHTGILDKLVRLIVRNPRKAVTIKQYTNPNKERAALAVNMVKEFMLEGTMPVATEEDLQEIKMKARNISNDDDDFISYVYDKVEGAKNTDLSGACIEIIGKERLDYAFSRLMNNRNDLILDYFLSYESVDPSNINISMDNKTVRDEENSSVNFIVDVHEKK